MVKFLSENWGFIAAFVAAVLAIIKADKTNKAKVANIAFLLVCQAEAWLGGKTGAIKKAFVYTWIRRQVPWVGWALSDAALDKIIEAAVDKLKDYLEKSGGKLPESIKRM